MEYLDAEQPVYLNEERFDNRFSSVDYEEDYGQRERVSGLGSGMITELAENLNTASDGLTVHDDGGDHFITPIPPRPAHTRQSQDGSNAEACTAEDGPGLYGTPRDVRSRRSSIDPFMPSADIASQRSETNLSQAEFSDEDHSYDTYDDSFRPIKSHGSRETTISTVPMTPATSSLLPWLNKRPILPSQSPPVPSIPSPPRPAVTRAKESMSRSAEPRRPAPAPMMAQTPIADRNGGWDGVIPRFR